MTNRQRGRPRAFDEGVVLDRALDAFWAAGYEATSLDDLAAATGLARASIYAAFDNKETLYLRTLERFAERMSAIFQESFARGAPLVDALTGFYLKSIALYFSGNQPRGCLAMCTAAASAVNEPVVRAALAASLQSIDDALAQAFRRAQSAGDLSPKVDAGIRARLASAALQSIALRARAGEARRSVEKFARETARFLCTP